MGRLLGEKFQAFEPDILLADGQNLAEYGWAAQVLYTPGHTKGSIAILTAEGELFVGDTLSNRGKLNSAPFFESAQELQASLTMLKGLKARVVYPGHGKPFAFEAVATMVE